MENDNQVRRLPLWEHTLEEMRKLGVDYGSAFSRKWLEDHLSCAWNTIEFNGAVHEIRCRLEEEGLFLSARRQGASGYVILKVEDNALQAARNQRLMLSLARRTVVLLNNTKVGLMGAADQRRHESALSKAAQRFALLKRTGPKPLGDGGSV